MTPGANSYGTAAGVAALSRVWTNNGSYDANTNPTVTTVESWIDSVSAIMNTSLASEGFSIPVSQADSKLAITTFVEQAVADLCQAANSSGRFFTERALERGVSPMASIRKEIDDWVQLAAPGMEALGASRQNSSSRDAVAYRETDTAGNEVVPFFQRSDYGDRKVNSDV
jgi:hypothetical protein